MVIRLASDKLVNGNLSIESKSIMQTKSRIVGIVPDYPTR